jgi:hypothetical protein
MVGGDQVFARITDAPWAGKTENITIGGAGGLGSWLAFFLGRIGHNLTVFDFDHVGIENIGGGQFYKQNQAGTEKTTALRQNLFDFVGHMNMTGFGRYEKGIQVNPITITTFDNMEARKDMMETWYEMAKVKPHGIDQLYAFINISMLPEGGFIEVIDKPSRAKKWLEEWVPSNEMPDLACTFKSTTHNAAIMAGYGVNMLNNLIFNHNMGEDLRYVPYHTTIDLPLVMLENHEAYQ